MLTRCKNNITIVTIILTVLRKVVLAANLNQQKPSLSIYTMRYPIGLYLANVSDLMYRLRDMFVVKCDFALLVRQLMHMLIISNKAE